MDILYKIPDSWVWTTLNELFLIERGGSPRPIQQFLTAEANGINWIKIGDTELGQKYIETTKEKIKPEGLKKSRLVVDGDFILSNSMSFGRPYIVKTTGAIHDGWLVFRDVDNNLDKDFFYYLLSSSYVYQQFSRNASGSTVRNLNIDIVKQTNISLPPLNEQKRIVTKIEKLFSNLDNSDKYLLHLEKQLKRYRQSVLKSAFEGEYKKIQWNEVTNIINGKHYTDVVNENGKYPIYGSAGIINYADEYLCNEDTVIVGRKGTINKPLFVKEKFWNIDTAFGIEANKERLAPMYLYYFSLSFNFLELNQSTTIPSLTKSNLLKINMPLPDTLDEQQEIVNQIEKHFSIIDKLETVVQQSIKESKRLRQSILKQAFEGKLVEQDPNDESASVLLEKIAKAKEEYLKAQKKQARKK
ncbi:MAG: restriction endonuclease subunit S [Fusobacteriaceae bacterium]|nr:restriction endonuclease subunit S [Fusobacteriaceae bacterium]